MGNHDIPVPEQNRNVRRHINLKLGEKGIEWVPNVKVTEIKPNDIHSAQEVVLNNGTSIHCDVAVWATGAEA